MAIDVDFYKKSYQELWSLSSKKEEALKYLTQRYRDYISGLNNQKAAAQVKLMDLEEQFAQLHV